MSQSSEKIAQQYIDGGVVPADLVSQDAATKVYVDDQMEIRDGRIDATESQIATNKSTMDTHIADTSVHVTTAEKLAYNNHIANTDIHVTTTDKTNWNSKAPGSTATDLQAHVGNSVIHTTQAEHDKLANIQAGAQVNQNAFSKVNSLSAASTTDEFFIVGDIGITVTTNPITKEVRITATGSATPGAHASTHITGGTDVIADAVTNGNSGLMSGADAQFVRVDGETKTGAQTKVDTHGNLTSAHGAVSAPTASRLIIRDTAGRAQVAAPSAAADIARLDTVTGQVGTLSDLQTTAKGNTVAAINEVFQSGVSAKQGVVDAINAKGGSASTSDSWATLASKIQSISTGKKFASGTITASATTRTFTQRNTSTSTRRFVEISGLGFRPKTIILRLGILSNVVDGAFLQLSPIGGAEEYGVMNNGDVPRIYELSGSGTRTIDGYINDSVALLPVASSGEYAYYAYE
ncbi:hypothetical protein MKZ12_07300 [Paenibacillus sp. FSL R5-0713]|uniref:hypothetical protein n=1 Tax=Paenibacillus sp. FSL R5-0713 TaxID=2921655 RepID=UPI0030D8D59B